MERDRVFRLFASVVPVRGARRSTLCDLQRESVRLIPNGLYEILTLHRGKTVAEVQAAYENRFDREIEEYFEFLLREEMGFWCDDPDAFPDLDLSWEGPELVTNAVIDVDASSDHPFAALFAQLDDLGCKALQLRYFRPCAPEEAHAVLSLLRYGRLRAAELLAPWSDAWTDRALEALCAEHPRLSGVVLHSAPETRNGRSAGGAALLHRRERVESAAHCGFVSPAYFVVNMAAFTEAQRHNSCLNRKIAVDAAGEIRNCPAMPRSFGNAREVSLHSALLREGFRELWEVNKDQVEVCRECEFRYVCTDCRAFVRDPADRFSKPSRCAYDPYTATWADAPTTVSPASVPAAAS